MSDSNHRALSDRLDTLRREFDGSFATAPNAEPTPVVDLLEIRVGGDVYALRRSEVGGLFAEKAIIALPSREPRLLGIAGFRGAIVPVYDLHALLGYSASGERRWLVTSASEPRVGLAFAEFERFTSVSPEAIVTVETPIHCQEATPGPSGTRPIVRLPSVLDAIRARVHRALA